MAKYRSLGLRKNVLKKSNVSIDKKILEFNLTSITGINNSHNLKIPKKLTPDLAEEIGIHIGDGHLSKNRYRYKIFGNIDESEYYTDFIMNLYKNLYNLDVKITKRNDNTIGFELCSKLLWMFKTEILGLEPGRKNNIGVPKIILNSNQNILRAFIRGFFDTDGNVYFQSRYEYKKYYPLLTFTLKSKKLNDCIKDILNLLGFKISLYRYKRDGCFSIQLYGYDNILKYAHEIGWHNNKHMKKFLEWIEKYPNLCK